MPDKLINVKICFRIYDKFLLQYNYFYKEMEVQECLPMEEVYGAVINRYPKFVYFNWKGQTIKNTSDVKK
jgi:hypothetical protein